MITQVKRHEQAGKNSGVAPAAIARYVIKFIFAYQFLDQYSQSKYSK